MALKNNRTQVSDMANLSIPEEPKDPVNDNNNARNLPTRGGYWTNDMTMPTYTASGAQYSYGKAPTYTSKYQDQINSMVDAILNREKFSYDYNKDPLYQQYAEAYTRNGQQAMNDTYAQMSARTGGLASSYAGTASQQAYNRYMDALNDKIPELYQLAYSMYQDEGNTMRNNLGMVQGLESTDYSRFLDDLSQWNTDRDWNYNVWKDNLSRQEAAARSAYNNRLAAYDARDQLIDAHNAQVDADYQKALDDFIASTPKYDSKNADQYDYGVWNSGKGYEFMGQTYSSPDAVMTAVANAGMPKELFTNTIKTMYRNGIITKAQYDELLKGN